MHPVAILVLLSAAFSLAVPRVRRQTEQGPFWWENLDSKVNSKPPNEIPVVNQPPLVSPIDAVKESIPCNGPGTECVPYYQCSDENSSTDGSGIIDIRTGPKCSRVLDVCCSSRNVDVNTQQIDPTATIHDASCGHRNHQGVHVRIQGFNVSQTQFGEYPWMVAILRIETIGNEEVNLYLCGGSIIEENIVLTAAHCVSSYEAKYLKIRAGEWDTQSEYEIYPHEDRLVSKVIIHPEFDGGSLRNDFAILVLDSPLTLSPHIDTVCLPIYGDSFDHAICQASGWGKDKFGKGGKFQNILRQVDLEIVPRADCVKALRSTRLGQYFELHSSFLCAGGQPEVDTCKGDGGSPLVCSKPAQPGQDPVYYQVGIVAWGIGCGENEIPGVYADVTKAVNWIYEVMNPHLIQK